MTAAKPPPGTGEGRVDWAAALAAHRRWLRTVVLARVGPQAVEEVMQEVALAAVKQEKHTLADGQVPTWLHRVAVRQSLLYRRRAGRENRRRAEYARRAEPARHSGEAGNPLRWLLADEEASLVRAGLQRLTRQDRELLLLKYTEDWSCKELAEHLGVRVTTVETRLHRARGRLRQLLADLDVRT